MATERTVLVRLKANDSDFVRTMGTAAAAVKGLRHEIDTTNDRTAWLAQSILALGPALVPLGAAAVPVFAGLITQMTVTGVAAGTLGLAFHGIGDALKALNDYQLDPTQAHLEKMQETMAKIGPEGQHFVEFLDSLGPQLTELSAVSRRGFFPGAEEGLTDMMTLLPQVSRIVGETSEALGQLAAEAGEGLSGPRFVEFFDFLESDAKPILVEMGHTIGNFIDGFAAMIVAFAPLSRDMSAGFEDMSKSFADWAHGLDSSTDFQDFVAYIRESGPKALDLLGSMADAFISILEAAAPVGDVMLPVLTKFFDIIAKLADTPLGPIFLGAAAAASVYGRAVALASITTGGMFKTMTPGLRTMNEQWRTTPIPTIRQFGTAIRSVATSNAVLEKSAGGVNRVLSKQATETMRARTSVGQFARSMGPTAAAVGLLATSMSGLDEKMGLTNTTTLGLMGLMVGPWGGALGAAAGAVLDLRAANNDLEDSIDQVYQAAKNGDFDTMTAGIKKLKAELADAESTSGFGDFLNDTLKDWGHSITHPGSFGAGNAREHQIDAGIAAAKTVAADTRAAAASELLARGFDATSAAADSAAKSTIDFRNSVQALNDELEGRASMRDYEAAIDEFRDSLKENGKTLDINTKKGRANQAALDNIASSALAMAEKLTGVDRVAFLDAARGQFIKAAKAAGMTTEAARALADEVLGLNNIKGTPKIKIDANGAYTVMADVQRRLNAFKDKTIRMTVLTNINHANSVRGELEDVHGQGADGATVPKSGLPYADRYLWAVADGEEIVSDRYGGATKNRNALKAASRGATLAVVGYAADGATVRTPAALSVPASVSVTTSIDYNRLAALIAARTPRFRELREAHASALRQVLHDMPIQRVPADLLYGMDV